MSSYSNVLFAKGGFLPGVARILDIGGRTRRQCYALTTKADMLAIYSDWRSVGQDLRHGLEQAKDRVADYQPALFDLNEG